MARFSDISIIANVLLSSNTLGIVHAYIERLRSCFPDVKAIVDFSFLFVESDEEFKAFTAANARKSFQKSFLEMIFESTESFQGFMCFEIERGIFSLIPLLSSPNISLSEWKDEESRLVGSSLWSSGILYDFATWHTKLDNVVTLDVHTVPSSGLGRVLDQSSESGVTFIIPSQCIDSYHVTVHFYQQCFISIPRRDSLPMRQI
jgi:hypothetical protein